VEGEEGFEDESFGRGDGLRGMCGLRGSKGQASCERNCYYSLGWESVLLLRHCIATGVFMDIPSDSVST